MIELENRKILVIGAGKTGKAVAEFLLHKGAYVILNDKNSININLNHKNLKIIENGHPAEIFEKTDLIVISPGIDRKKLPIPDGKEVIGDIELFYLFNTSKIIAITGTNGKTTTTTLAGEILKTKYKTFIGGNIGTPAIEIFKTNEHYDFSILELSSFQLECIKNFTPDIAVILNITPDHLDRYKDFNEYANAKMNILKNRKNNQLVIMNKSIKRFIKDSDNFYFYNIDDVISNNKVNIRYKNCKLTLDTEKILIKGKHFYEDIFVASLIGIICGVNKKDIEQIVYKFKGLEHRLELVTEKNGVKFFNDSKSTTVTSTCKAIESFENPVILILGGIHKGESFKKIEQYKHLKKIICFGKAKQKISNELKSISPYEVGNLEQAVKKAKSFATHGDIILFSPACASFDMFENYKQRGKKFKEIVNE